MKNFLLLFLVSLTLSTSSFATHLLGGEILVEQIGFLTYKATFVTYTKESSIPANTDTLEIRWGDGTVQWILKESNTSLGKSITKNIYTGTHAYLQEGNFIISTTSPNRTHGMININPPSSDLVPFHVQTSIVASNLWSDTPVLLNPPVDEGLIGHPFEHNAAAADWDGDSLAYRIVTPMQALNAHVPNYSFPNQINPAANNQMILDEVTGTLTWDSPQAVGIYGMAIAIDEFRDGELLSTVIRDFSFKIYDGDNVPPVVSIPFNEITLQAGDTLSFEVLGNDVDDTALNLQGFGIPLLLANNAADFTPSASFVSSPITENFHWITHNNHVAIEPYFLYFRLEDSSIQFGTNNCGTTHYQVLKINIEEVPVASHFQKVELGFEIFPNPNPNGVLFVKIPPDFSLEKTTYQIVDETGKLILDGKFTPTLPTQNIDLQHLTNGNYFISIKTEKGIQTERFILQNNR